MLLSYAASEDFKDIYPDTQLEETEINRYLWMASRDIDVLTFNRITAAGFDQLTEYQQETIKEVVCRHASFLCENEEMLETYLAAYSINGVSMNFGDSWNLKVQDGVAIKMILYKRLISTNLCWRGGI